MGNRLLVFYGSYRSDRKGIRLVHFLVERLHRRGDDVEFIDAMAVNLPILDRMYKEYPKGHAPEALEQLAGKIREADGFVFVTGEYNWGIQPGLKNLTDHFLDTVAVAAVAGTAAYMESEFGQSNGEAAPISEVTKWRAGKRLHFNAVELPSELAPIRMSFLQMSGIHGLASSRLASKC